MGGYLTSRPAATATARWTCPILDRARFGCGAGCERLNHLDLWLRQGLPKPPMFPMVPGGDGAGTVDAVGRA